MMKKLFEPTILFLGKGYIKFRKMVILRIKRFQNIHLPIKHLSLKTQQPKQEKRPKV